MTCQKPNCGAGASPARTSPTPADVPESGAKGQDYFSTGCDWPLRYDPDTCCWRTSAPLLTGDSPPYLGRWPKAGMMLSGTASQRPPLVPRISAAGFLSSGHSIPTPTSSDSSRMPNTGRNSKGPTIHEVAEQNMTIFPTPYGLSANQGQGDGEFGKAIRHWPTPTGNDNDNRRTKPTPAEIEGRHGWSLMSAICDAEADDPVRNWRTPGASETTGGATNAENRKKQGHAISLSDQVNTPSMWPEPEVGEIFCGCGHTYTGTLKDKCPGCQKYAGSAQITYPTLTSSMMAVGDMEQARYAGSDPKRPSYEDANKMHPPPTGRDWKGGRSSEETQARNSRPLNEAIENQAADGQLNADWVSILMDFPPDWTVVEDGSAESPE